MPAMLVRGCLSKEAAHSRLSGQHTKPATDCTTMCKEGSDEVCGTVHHASVRIQNLAPRRRRAVLYPSSWRGQWSITCEVVGVHYPVATMLQGCAWPSCRAG